MSAPLNPFGPNAPGPGNPYQAPGGFSPQYAPPQQPNPALGIASLVCGILGFPLTCCCGIFAIPLPFLAVGLGVVALILPNAGGKPMAIAGIVCGVLAILLSVGLLVFALSNPDALRQWQQMQNR